MTTRTRMSAADFDRFVLLPENADRRYEYIEGVVVEVVSQHISSAIGTYVGRRMTVFAVARRLGRVTIAGDGYQVDGERYIPDAAFIAKARQPIPPDEAAYNPLAPDLAVEVLSAVNDAAQIAVKIRHYLASGTVVWLFDPDRRTVTVYAPGARTLTDADLLDGGDLLPGFALDLADVFAL